MFGTQGPSPRWFQDRLTLHPRRAVRDLLTPGGFWSMLFHDERRRALLRQVSSAADRGGVFWVQ